MPCGPLQSMWIVAFISANPVSGALSMFCFSIGTVPLMLGLGSLVSALGKRFAGRVMEVGSVLAVVLGLVMLTQGLSLSGISVWSLPGSSLEGVTAESAEGGTTALVPEGEITVPVSAGYVIPSEKLAVAEESENGDFKQIVISLTDQGFSPAVIVVEKNTNVVWYIQSDRSRELLVPAYSTKLPLAPGNNGLSLIPLESFEVSTGDHAFYAYVKVVDALDDFDEDAVRKEVSEFETLIYPDSVFEASGMSCCQ